MKTYIVNILKVVCKYLDSHVAMENEKLKGRVKTLSDRLILQNRTKMRIEENIRLLTRYNSELKEKNRILKLENKILLKSVGRGQ